MALLSFSNLTTGHPFAPGRAAPVSEALSGSLDSGEFVCLLGPNGVGKSTLLNTLAGTLAPLAGEVRLDSWNLHALRPSERAKHLAVVSTDRAPATLLTVYDFAALGRHPFTDWMGRLQQTDHDMVRTALESAGAWDLRGRLVAEVSDGERQRAVIARALAQQPRLLLLDEVTAFLDLPNRVHTMRLLRRLARTTGTGVVLSTHDLDLALRAADHLWLLTSGGLVTGAPEDLVLSGAFEQVFRADDVTFDRRSGSFRVHESTGRLIAVSGDGPALEWTRRALERGGFRVGDDAARDVAARVVARASGNQTIWTVAAGSEQQTCPTLASLVEWTRQHVGSQS